MFDALKQMLSNAIAKAFLPCDQADNLPPNLAINHYCVVGISLGHCALYFSVLVLLAKISL